MANDKKDVLYALQTSRGVVTFDDPSELQPWLDKGMNRFDLVGPPVLNEIEVLHPEQRLPCVVYVGVDWDTKEIRFFEDGDECAVWTEESDNRESDYTTEVL